MDSKPEVSDGAEMPIRDRRGLPFITVDRSVILDSGMSAHAKLVYTALCAFAGWTSGQCWPSVRTLSANLQMERPTIRRAITELVDRQLIRVDPRPSINGGQTSHLYTLLPTTKMTHLPSHAQLGLVPPDQSATRGQLTTRGGGSNDNPLVGQSATGGGSIGYHEHESSNMNHVNEKTHAPPEGVGQTATRGWVDQYRALMDGFKYEAEVVERSKAMKGCLWASAKELGQGGFGYDDIIYVIEQLRPRFKQFGPAAVAKWAVTFVKR